MIIRQLSGKEAEMAWEKIRDHTSKVCEVKWCGGKYIANGFCWKHYMRLRRARIELERNRSV
jgi:hypothetical protein